MFYLPHEQSTHPDNRRILGANSSAIQSEDHPDNNHRWRQGHLPGSPAFYGRSAEFDTRYPSDIEAMAQLGLNALGFSPLSSRVVVDGQFSQLGIDHYKRMAEFMLRRNITPILKIQHFDPLGYYWHDKDAVAKYLAYADFVLKNLGDLVRYVIPINEPKVNANLPFQEGVVDINTRDPRRLFWILDSILTAIENQAEAHKQTYHLAKSFNPDIQVMTAENIGYFEAYGGYWWNKILSNISEAFDLTFFLDKINDHYDILGVNYYWHRVFKLFPPKVDGHDYSETGARLTPHHLYDVLLKANAYTKGQKPIMVTEIGAAVKDDSVRARYFAGSADAYLRAEAEGVPLLGFLIWSLTDNYEFARHGYGAKFGIQAVDFQTQERTIRPSVYEILDRLKEP